MEKISTQFEPRNPIGMLALFVMFIETIAGIVLAVHSTVNSEISKPLVWFIIVFPSVIFVFLLLF